MVHSDMSKLYTGCIADENDSEWRYSEVLLKGKNKTLVKILGVATLATPAALTTMRGTGSGGLMLQT